jgi:hypothetical protein
MNIILSENFIDDMGIIYQNQSQFFTIRIDGIAKNLFTSAIEQFRIKRRDVLSVKNFKLFEEVATSF